LDFAEVEHLQLAGRWRQAGELLADAARFLEGAGAELLVLCTNTMHRVADQVQAAVEIPLLHIADVTADAVRQAGLATVGLLGTAFTMEQNFYRSRLAGYGLTVLTPPQADSPVPIFPTTRLHVAAAVDHALADTSPRTRRGALAGAYGTPARSSASRSPSSSSRSTPSTASSGPAAPR
jgi:aspartate/glutamate racemase